MKNKTQKTKQVLDTVKVVTDDFKEKGTEDQTFKVLDSDLRVRLPEVKKTIASDSTTELKTELNQVKHLESKMNNLLEENRKMMSSLSRAEADLSVKENHLKNANWHIDLLNGIISQKERDLSDFTTLTNKLQRLNKVMRLGLIILGIFSLVELIIILWK